MKSLRGKLLLASRRLADPNFFRTIVLMVQHGDEGALGLVLNRPLETTVKEACDDDLELVCQTDGVLHQGGPCQGPLMAVHKHRSAGPSEEVFTGVYFSTERNELEWLLKQASPKVKFFVGYAGWGPGQLEGELDSGSWLITPATTQSVFADDESDQWSKLVMQTTFGSEFKADQMPDDPSVN